MLHVKDTNRETERIEEWPGGPRVTERAQERIREIHLGWDSIKALGQALAARFNKTTLLELVSRTALLLLLKYLIDLLSSQP